MAGLQRHDRRDFGNADNLMIDNALIEHGGRAMVRHRAVAANLFTTLPDLRCLACCRSGSKIGKAFFAEHDLLENLFPTLFRIML